MLRILKLIITVAIDTKASKQNELEAQGIPHCILLDPDGIVRWEGYPTLKDNELTETVLTNIIKNIVKACYAL